MKSLKLPIVLVGLLTFSLPVLKATQKELETLNAIHEEYCPATQRCASPENFTFPIIDDDDDGGESTLNMPTGNPSMENADRPPFVFPPDNPFPFPTVDSDYKDGSCCGGCSCDLQTCAMNGTCCPDTLEYLPTVEESRAKVKMTCEYAQFRKSDSGVNTGLSLWMLTTCADDYGDSQISFKCQNNTIVRPFDMELLLPVTDLSTGITYQNKYCALCNHINDEFLNIWDAGLQCAKGVFIPSSVETVIEEVLQTDYCDIVYEPTAVIRARSLPICAHVIGECNVTGKWKVFDPFLEKACHAYEAVFDGRENDPYAEDTGIKYRNIFCYKCNEVETPLPHCDSPMVPNVFMSFSAILQLTSETRVPEEIPDPDTCSASQILDPMKNRCREVTCLPPKILLEGNCTDAFSYMHGLIYAAYIKVAPSEAVDIAALPNVSRSLTHKLQTVLSIEGGWFGTFSVFDVFYKHVIQFKPVRPMAAVQSLSLAEYFVVHIQTYIYPRSNTITFINTLLQLDGETDSIDFSYISSDGQEIRKSVDIQFELEVYWKVDPSTSETKTLGVRDGSFLTFFQSMYSDLPYFDIESSGIPVITPTMGCPLVDISDYATEPLPNGDLIVSELGYTWTAKDFTRRDNDEDSVLVCRDRFMQVVETQLQRGRVVSKTPLFDHANLRGILSFVCAVLSLICLCLTLLTYLLFKNLRTQPGINNMCLVLSLIIAQSLYQFGVGQADQVPAWGCQTLGVLIHFFWLMSVFWMNVCSYHMFRVFSSLTKISRGGNVVRRTLLYWVYCFTASAVFVAINLVVSRVKSNSTELGYGGTLCYVSDYFMNLYTFAIPVGAVVVVNICLFITVICKIAEVSKTNKTLKRNRNYIKIYMKLSCLTGVSWLFGFLVYTDIVAFEYLFIICTGGQGVFLFISFVCKASILNQCMQMVKGEKPSNVTVKSDQRNASTRTEDSTLSNTSNGHCGEVAETRTVVCTTAL